MISFRSTLLLILLWSSPIQAQTDLPHIKTFQNPMYAGLRLDFCYRSTQLCGEEAARRYCNYNHYQTVADGGFEIDPNVGSTISLGDNRSDGRDGFKFIKCIGPVTAEMSISPAAAPAVSPSTEPSTFNHNRPDYSAVAVYFGVAFVLLLFITALTMIFFPRNIPAEAMWILRVILALAGAGLGAGLSGMLTVTLTLGQGLVIQAASGFALFVLIYLVNPPEQFKDRTPQ